MVVLFNQVELKMRQMYREFYVQVWGNGFGIVDDMFMLVMVYFDVLIVNVFWIVFNILGLV